MSARRSASLLESFNYALEGIIHVLRTHRNMRFHFAAAVIVLVAAVWVGVDRIELAALLISIAFVLIAEMVNSALETAVDMATTTFDPLAKLAKDVAAGAVLIAAVNAVAVGYLVFSHKLGTKASKGLDRLRDQPAEVTAIALIVTILIVIGTKAYTGRGRPLRGGLPSGHAALAFAGWMAATYLIPDERRFLASVITLIMALLVAQTRVEAGFHSALEVAYGGLLGALTTLVIFQVFS
jgi:diacylglycerol kinase (ATP)